MFTVPRPAGVYSAWALDVNDAGLVGGACWKSGAGMRGFIYSIETGIWTEIEPLPGGAWASVNAINSKGQCCGFRSIGSKNDPVHPWQAFIWSAEAGYTDLGVMNGPSSGARAISDDGTVVGWTGQDGSTTYDDTRAFIHQGGHTTILAAVPSGLSSMAVGVSNSIEVLVRGRLQVNPPITLTYLYSKGEFEQMPLPDGYDRAIGLGMNNQLAVVGGVSHSSNPSDVQAALWHDNGVILLEENTETIPQGLSLEFGIDVSENDKA